MTEEKYLDLTTEDKRKNERPQDQTQDKGDDLDDFRRIENRLSFFAI